VNVGLDRRWVVERAARTNRISGRVYWLKIATWQVGQRQICCFLPPLRGTATGRGSPASSTGRSVSIRTLTTNALPV